MVNEDNDLWTEHAVWGMEDWRAEVAAKDTLRGYWDWVNHKLEESGEPAINKEPGMIKGRFGAVLGPRELIMRFTVGTASAGEDGPTFEMAHAQDISPMVECTQTRKTFWLSWKNIIEMAEQAGITKEDINV